MRSVPEGAEVIRSRESIVGSTLVHATDPSRVAELAFNMTDQAGSAGPLGKIVSHTDGLGTITPEMVEERALELARTDGRQDASDADRAQAQDDFLGGGGESSGPETIDPALENVTEWDDSPMDHGTQAPEVRPEDDVNIAEALVREGMEEADHDQRVSAANEFPPEEL